MKFETFYLTIIYAFVQSFPPIKLIKNYIFLAHASLRHNIVFVCCIADILNDVVFCQYDLAVSFLVPVDHHEEDGHAEDTINEFQSDQDGLKCVVELVVVYCLCCLHFVFVLVHLLEIAMKNHRQWSVSVYVFAVSFEAMIWVP